MRELKSKKYESHIEYTLYFFELKGLKKYSIINLQVYLNLQLNTLYVKELLKYMISLIVYHFISLKKIKIHFYLLK